jgi:HlyD family secretion protein
MKALKTLLIVVLVLGALGGGAYGLYYWWQSGPKAPTYRTAEVTRGKLTHSITATGTIEPEEVIDVGAQIVGQIKSFGVDPRDLPSPAIGLAAGGPAFDTVAPAVAAKGKSGRRFVDYCTPVEPGTVLAYIDDALYAPDVEVAREDVKVAKAAVTVAEANVNTARAKLDQNAREWERNKKLGKGFVTDTDYDTALNNYETAKAALPAAEASLKQATTNVERAQAILNKAEKNLGYCTIVSPVKGVIVDRRVNVGQTVVSGLSAPSLFLLAKDLMKLQVWVAVNEADIGNIHIGQDVNFTVDARPGKTFKGKVQQIRYNATMTQNVVTYTVVVAAPNEKLPRTDQSAVTVKTPSAQTVTVDDEYALLPYLTASVQFLVDHRDDSLLVPNAALRYRPQQASQVAEQYRDEYEKGQQKRKAAQSPDEPKGDKDGEKANRPRGNVGTVWVEQDGYLMPIKVETGITDNTLTEVKKVLPDGTGERPDWALDEQGNLRVGLKVVTGENQQGGAQGTTNPFTPQMFGGQKKKDQ